MGAGQAADKAADDPSLRFGDDAAQYEKARPAHPAWVFDALLDGLGPCRALDVGCGTGAAALELRQRGCDVIGVEPDPRMAAVAADRGLAVEVVPFERWDAGGRQFDLVCSAQAWHWVDSAVGLEVAASALRPGGRFAAFWYGHRHEPDVDTAIRAARDLLELPSPAPLDLGASARTALARRGDAFTRVESRGDSFSATYSTEDWIQVEASFGANRALPKDRREQLFAEIRHALSAIAPITVHWDTTLVTATRRA